MVRRRQVEKKEKVHEMQGQTRQFPQILFIMDHKHHPLRYAILVLMFHSINILN